MNLRKQLQESGVYGPVRIRHCSKATFAKTPRLSFGTGDPFADALHRRGYSPDGPQAPRWKDRLFGWLK